MPFVKEIPHSAEHGFQKQQQQYAVIQRLTNPVPPFLLSKACCRLSEGVLHACPTSIKYLLDRKLLTPITSSTL